MISEESKLAYLFSLKPDTITATDIFRLFGQQSVKDADGKVIRVEPALFRAEDKIHVKKGQLQCIKSDIDTTAGRYLFNLVTIEAAFGGTYSFVNKTLRDDDISKLQSKLFRNKW